jgi:AraC-like DNA-binding protein
VRELLCFAAEEGLARRPHYHELIALSVESALYLLVRGNPPPAPEAIATTSEAEAPLLFRVRTYLDTNLDTRITLDTLAEYFSLSREHLCRRFSETFGMSPIRYLNLRRHERACTLLTGTDMTVTEVAAAVGYTTVHYFSRVFRSFEGVSPQEYRQSRRNNIIVDMK